MLKAIKVRIYPTDEQRTGLAVQFGCARFVYNNALEYKQSVYKETGQNVSFHDLITRLPQLKTEFPWLGEADSQALQQSILHLQRAYVNFFEKRARFPQKKKKHNRNQSYQYPQRVKIEADKIYLPKVGWVEAMIHRPVESTIKTVTVSLAPTGKYFASILMDDGVAVPAPVKHLKADEVEAVDLGLENFYTDSNGNKIANPRFLKRAANNLRKKQKFLSRKKKGSNNRNKARIKVAKAHEKAANARSDFQHKLSYHLAGENQAVGMESLRVKNMLKNRRLAKAIGDAGWGSFMIKVRYKCLRMGKRFVKIDTFYPSSKTCNQCTNIMDELPLKVRVWTCPVCKTVHDRDHNAAINIKYQTILELKAAGCTVSVRRGLRKTSELEAAA
jgi:putative transposase